LPLAAVADVAGGGMMLSTTSLKTTEMTGHLYRNEHTRRIARAIDAPATRAHLRSRHNMP